MAPHVEILLLDGGSFIADTNKLHAGVQNEQIRLYNWSFFVSHPETGRKVLWDVGMSSNIEDYSTFVQNHMYRQIHMCGPRISLDQQILNITGVSADNITDIVFSHAHFDHCRPMSHTFPCAKMYFGPGTRESCAPGHLKDPTSQWDGRFFDPVQRTEEWDELQGPWEPMFTFEKTMDFFNDGSFYIVQAPGHMKGNLCAVCRLHNGEYVVLGSDCCHSRELYQGVHDFAVFDLPNGSKGCLQEDISAAKDTLTRIRGMEAQFGGHIAFAHDHSWILTKDDEVLLTLLQPDFRRDAPQRIQKGLVV